MADEALVMGTERAINFQNNIEKELVRRGYDADQVMAEYIAIMVINNKTADQINAELSDLIGPEYDPDFSKWLFNAAKQPQVNSVAPPPAPQKPSRLVSQAFEAATSSGLKRPSSPHRDGGPNKARKIDAPSAPRAMREETSPAPTSPTSANGLEGKSLLQRIETFDSRQDSREYSRDHSFPHRGDRGRPYRDRNDRNDRHFNNRNHNQPNQNQPNVPMQNFDPAFMMDPAMMMGMNMQMNPMAFQEIIGNNMAMMQQMASMMMTMHQQQQTQQTPQAMPVPQQNGSISQKKPPTTSNNTLSADATPFQPTIFVHDKPGSTSICKHGVKCNNARCRDSHPSPVATAESGVVLSTEVCDKGPGGSECKDADCTKSHISPAATKPGVKVQFVPSTTGAPSSGTTNATTATVAKAATPAATTPAPKPAAPAPNAPTGQVPIPCKFGVHCTRPGCHFLHPGRRSNSNNSTPCRFGAKCTRGDCTYSHPPGRTLPNQFHKGLSLSTKPTEAYQPAPHRTMVFNVPKKKVDGTNPDANAEANKENADLKKSDGSVDDEKEVEGVV